MPDKKVSNLFQNCRLIFTLRDEFVCTVALKLNINRISKDKVNDVIRGCLQRRPENNAELKEYSGQALSYAVLEDWAALGIGATILPKSKISEKNKNARRLFLTMGNRPKLFFIWFGIKTRHRANHLSSLCGISEKMFLNTLRGLFLKTIMDRG